MEKMIIFPQNQFSFLNNALTYFLAAHANLCSLAFPPFVTEKLSI
jgi:hypothetical protein